jgi:hypothetical protein
MTARRDGGTSLADHRGAVTIERFGPTHVALPHTSATRQ